MGARGQTARWARKHGALARLVLLGRIVAVLACLHLSGVGHVVTDCLVALDVISDHCDDCDDEPPGDCPPGCPNCHAGVASLPPSSVVSVRPAPTTSDACPVEDADRAPAEPCLSTLYRPPRPPPSSIS